jgi:hypothetical protein
MVLTRRLAAASIVVACSIAACGEGELEDGTGGASSTATGTASTTTDAAASTSTGEKDTPPPTVSAGDDLTLEWPIDRIPLQAIGTSVDTIRWDVVDAPGEPVIRAVRTSNPTVTALRIGDTTVEVTVTNEDGETATDDVVIHVLPPAIEPSTPLAWSTSLPRPTFRVGHDLPPLTRVTGPHVLELQKQLAQRYGYALDLGETSPAWDDDFASPNGSMAQKIALKALDPDGFALSIQVWRPLLDDPEAYAEAYPDMLLRGDGGEPSGGVSSEAPDAVFEEIAEASASRLRAIQERVAAAVPSSPYVDVVLNGGGYGLGVWGLDDDLWLDDPTVRAAIEDRFVLEPGEAPSDEQKLQYISERKAHQEGIVTAAHEGANPGGIYAFARTWSWGLKERDPSWWRFAWDFPEIADLSSPPGVAVPLVWYGVTDDARFEGDADALSQLTNAQAWQEEQGAPLQYLSTSGGWPGGGDIADDDLYMGYLKVAYTVGVIGGTSAYFDDPGWGEEDTGASDEMPSWVRQLVTLGEVHALFSHLEGYLRFGTLLPGPNAHRWSSGKPAYELEAVAGGEPDPGVRVIGRRNAAGDGWLVTVWAFDGDDREVAVEVDTLGEIALSARRAGSVYVITTDDGDVEARLLDPDAMLPTDTMLESDEHR